MKSYILNITKAFIVALFLVIPSIANACVEWNSNIVGTSIKNGCKSTVNIAYCIGQGCTPALFNVIRLLPNFEKKISERPVAGRFAYCQAPLRPTEDGCK